jgi:site-specific recombinase XerD
MSTANFFVFPKTLRRMHQGPLGVYIDEFAALLQQQGYSRMWACVMIRLVADFSRWLYRRYLGAEDVDADRLKRFLAHRKRTRTVGLGDPATLRKMLALLHKKGVVRLAGPPKSLNACERACEDFWRYLVQQCGLSTITLKCYRPWISRFLAERFQAGPVEFKALVAADITGFVQRHSRDQSHSGAQHLVTALRAFLRYLQHKGEIAIDLAACVPAVANWSFSALPKFLLPDQVEQVLDHCNRATVAGRRDYAILLLLARLGLRAGEVAALRLDDIDWEQSQLSMRSKGRRRALLPLPADVGQAICDYLTAGRPPCTDRHVFIREHAPVAGLADATSISALVKRALRRAGIDSPRKGAHLFRHSLATEMLKQGASLREIGEVLRHRNPDTTQNYAKVDISALQGLALPWPGGA